MRSKMLMLVALLALVAPFAQAAAAGKVAILDLQAVVLGSNAGQGQMQELERNPEYAKLVASMEDIEADLQSLDNQLKNEGLTWGEDKKQKHVAKMNELARDRQGALNQLNRVRESVFMQLLNAMEPAIGAALQEIMTKDGVDLVLDSKAVIHSAQSVDITPKVVDRLNKMTAAAAQQAR